MVILEFFTRRPAPEWHILGYGKPLLGFLPVLGSKSAPEGEFWVLGVVHKLGPGAAQFVEMGVEMVLLWQAIYTQATPFLALPCDSSRKKHL